MTDALINERVSEQMAAKELEILAIRQAHEQRVGELESEIAEQKASFDLRWKADMRAIKRWQEATGKKLIWPDHSDLCVWLLGQLEALSASKPQPVVTDEMVALRETCKTLSAAAEASIADMVLSAANGFRTAIVLANNYCVQVSDGHNADDQTEEAATASECARRIRSYVEASDQTILELMEEAGYPVASKPDAALSQPAGGGK